MQSYQRLEREFAAWSRLDPSGMVACSSGTAALHLALESLGLMQNCEVIVPDFTMVAVPRAVVLAGLKPVFVDCDRSLNMDPGLVSKAVSPLTKALIAVHTYGRQADVTNIERHLFDAGPTHIIEDLAEAHGLSPHRATSAACWSFYRNKIVHGEEGGAVWFPHVEHAKTAVSLRSLGFTEDHDFKHIPRGHNYRMANACATLVRCSLNAIQHIYGRRQRIVAAYEDACPDKWRMPKRDALWVYDIRIPDLDYDRQTAVVKELQAAGIPARHAFKPMHTLPEFAHCQRVGGDEAERASREVIYLPVRPEVKDEERAADAFRIIRRALREE